MPLQVINGIGRVGIRVASPAVSYDADAQAFITAAALTDTTQKDAINELVLDLKAAGVWTKLKAIYPMVGGTASTHKFNLKDPRDVDAAFRLTFNGGWTHSSTGALPNGSNAYANTYINPSVNLLQNSNNVTIYSRTSQTNNNVDLGIDSATYRMYFYVNYTNIIGGRNNRNSNETEFNTSNSNGAGFFQFNRNSSSNESIIQNTTIVNGNRTSNGRPNGNAYIGACNGPTISYSIRQIAFSSFGDGLTDLESNLFYQIVEKYQYALGRNINATRSFYFNRNYSNETNAFIFNGGITDATQISAVNTLVTTLKTAGVWTKMKAVYPMVGGTANSHKFNLVNPVDTDAAYRLVFNGGWTHSSSGALPNGSNAYGDTFLIPSTALSQNNSHISVYSRTNVDSAYTIGTNSGAPNFTNAIGIYPKSSNSFWAAVNQGSFYSISNTDAKGFFLAKRTLSTTFVMQKNSTQTSVNFNSSGLSTFKITLGALNSGGSFFYGSNEIAFATIGDGLTDAEATTFYNAVQAFQTTLNRQV